MAKRSDLYKGGTVFFFCPPEGRPEELVVLMRHGPLCVGRVFDWKKRELVEGLYWIYIPKHGATIGPFFADIHLAFKAMKKMVAHFGAPFFDQPLDWLRRQDAARAWIEKNVGKRDELVGGEWAKEGR